MTEETAMATSNPAIPIFYDREKVKRAVRRGIEVQLPGNPPGKTEVQWTEISQFDNWITSMFSQAIGATDPLTADDIKKLQAYCAQHAKEMNGRPYRLAAMTFGAILKLPAADFAPAPKAAPYVSKPDRPWGPPPDGTPAYDVGGGNLGGTRAHKPAGRQPSQAKGQPRGKRGPAPKGTDHALIERILTAVSGQYDVTREDLLSDSKSSSVARPRQVAMYLMTELNVGNPEAIGKAVHKSKFASPPAHKHIKEQMQGDEKLRAEIAGLKAHILDPAQEIAAAPAVVAPPAEEPPPAKPQKSLNPAEAKQAFLDQWEAIRAFGRKNGLKYDFLAITFEVREPLGVLAQSPKVFETNLSDLKSEPPSSALNSKEFLAELDKLGTCYTAYREAIASGVSVDDPARARA